KKEKWPAYQLCGKAVMLRHLSPSAALCRLCRPSHQLASGDARDHSRPSSHLFSKPAFDNGVLVHRLFRSSGRETTKTEGKICLVIFPFYSLSDQRIKIR